MLPITKMQATYKFSPRYHKITHIVWHNTGSFGKGSGAFAHFKSQNRADGREASADFYVDDKTILQCVDLDKQYTWHSGNKDMNGKSIGIEICEGIDIDYDLAVKNAFELTLYLMGLYGIPVSNVIRHHDVTGKMCPHLFTPDNWKVWWDIKDALAKKTYVPFKFKIDIGATPSYTSRTYMKEGDFHQGVKMMQKMLMTLGYPTEVDGIYDGGTVTAVKNFQTKTGLSADGIAGKLTIAKLYEIVATVPVQKPTPAPASAPAPDAWKTKALHELHSAGILDDVAGWTKNIDGAMPVWAVLTLLNNMYKKLSEK